MDEDDGAAIFAALIADVGALSTGEGDELGSVVGIFGVDLFGWDVIAHDGGEGERKDEDQPACYDEDGFCGGGHFLYPFLYPFGRDFIISWGVV